MTSLKLGEEIIDAMVAKLKDGLDARCAQINLEKSDGIEIHGPLLEGGGARDGTNYYTSGVSAIPQAPAIIVAEGPMERDEEQTEGPHSFVGRWEIGVFCLEEDADREILGKKLQRKARAVVETLWDDPPAQRLDNSAYYLMPLRTQPGNVFDPDDQRQTYRSFYVVLFEAKQLEG